MSRAACDRLCMNFYAFPTILAVVAFRQLDTFSKIFEELLLPQSGCLLVLLVSKGKG